MCATIEDYPIFWLILVPKVWATAFDAHIWESRRELVKDMRTFFHFDTGPLSYRT